MENFWLYLLIAAATIASPGPGVVMTLTNTLKYGLRHSLPGIFAVALGMFLIAALVGSGLGIIFNTAGVAYQILKIIGAAYLLYLGIKLIRNRHAHVDFSATATNAHGKKMFMHGLLITLTNPKAIVFFIALFPQFIDSQQAYLPQFFLLSLTFCVLIVLIHLLYGVCAYTIRQNTQRNYFGAINCAGGLAFITFALGLLFSGQKSASSP